MKNRYLPIQMFLGTRRTGKGHASPFKCPLPTLRIVSTMATHIQESKWIEEEFRKRDKEIEFLKGRIKQLEATISQETPAGGVSPEGEGDG